MSLPDSATQTPATHRSLRIDVRGRRHERRLGVLALLALAGSASLLVPSLLSVAVFFSASALILTGLWWHGWLGGAHRLTAVSWLADGSWILTDAAQANFSATLLPDSRVGSRWLWLRWHIGAGTPGPRRRSMLLVHGDVEGRDLRRLGVRLRLEPVRRPPSHARSFGA